MRVVWKGVRGACVSVSKCKSNRVDFFKETRVWHSCVLFGRGSKTLAFQFQNANRIESIIFVFCSTQAVWWTRARVVWKGVQSAQGATFPINSSITKISGPVRVVWKGVQSAQGATFPINSSITKISLCVFALCPWLHAWLGGWGRVAFSSTDDELLSRSPALAVPPGPRPRGTALLQVCLQVCLQLELWWVRGCEPTTIQHSPNKSMSSATRVSHQGQTPEHWTIGPQTTRLLQHRQLRELCECGAQLTASRSTNSSPASSICRRARSRRG